MELERQTAYMSLLQIVALLMLYVISNWSEAVAATSEGRGPSGEEAASDLAVEALWTAFKQQYGRQYNNDTEERFRRKVFGDNVEAVNRHNDLHRQGLRSFRTAINAFADMEIKEFVKKVSGYLYHVATAGSNAMSFSSSADTEKCADLPPSVDWRLRGVVTPVQNQGDCGACYAFSATGALEGQHCLKTGQLVQLSAQQLIDCSHDFGNRWCISGRMDWSFKYIKVNDGIDTAEAYPYEAKNSTCRYNVSAVGATDTGYVSIPVGDELALMEAVATVGPVSAAIDASQQSFMLYNSGVYDDPDCSDTANHSILIVGYGQENGTDYWLVKNSWGESWGDNGYVKMARNKSNQCAIATYASYPLV